VTLKDLDCFAPRVIFIKVVVTPELTQLQHEVKKFCRQELNLFNADYKEVPFHPHLTVAFRDLKKPMFKVAWEEFKSKEFSGEFIADRICLLKHDGKRWNVLRDFLLSGR
jgi:2'-5' RNA ligase